jgi:hypothetical protein
MKPISTWNIFARMGFLEKHVKSLNLDGMNMAILEARLDNLMVRVARGEQRLAVLIDSLAPTPLGRPKAETTPDEKINKRREYAREYYLRKKRKRVQAKVASLSAAQKQWEPT